MAAKNFRKKKPTFDKAVIVEGHDLHERQKTPIEQARLQRIAVWQREDARRQKRKWRLKKEAQLARLEKFEEIEKDLPKTVFDSDDLDIK